MVIRGFAKTRAAVRERYAWRGLDEDVERILQLCAQCWKNKPPRRYQKTAFSLPRGCPGGGVAMNLSGHLPESTQGHLYVLALLDRFSLWVELIPLCCGSWLKPGR